MSTFRCVFSIRDHVMREMRWNSSCIFFLTFNAKHLIKGTQPRSRKSGANFDVKGESIDEERNEEESACQEEGCSEEKEVVSSALSSSSTNRPRAIGAVFIWHEASIWYEARTLTI
jgi:hypothetical protein